MTKEADEEATETSLDDKFKEAFRSWVKGLSPNVPDEKIDEVSCALFRFVKGVVKLDFETIMKIVNEIKGMPLTMQIQELERYSSWSDPSGS
jgi:hypothetical protein